MCVCFVLHVAFRRVVNSQIKASDTKRKRFSVISFATLLINIVEFYSLKRDTDFSTTFKLPKNFQQYAKKYSIEDFARKGRMIYQLKSHKLNVESQVCDCCYFLKWGICQHLYSYNKLHDEFSYKEKRGRKGASKKASKALKKN